MIEAWCRRANDIELEIHGLGQYNPSCSDERDPTVISPNLAESVQEGLFRDQMYSLRSGNVSPTAIVR